MQRRSSSAVDTDVVLRAVAIAWVVANHSQVGHELGGGMTLLFMLSGFTFARFALDGRRAEETRAFLARFGWRICVPSLAVIALAQLQLGRFEPLELLFVSNWTEREHVARLPVWYVQVLLQMFVLLYGLFLVPAISSSFREKPLRASAALFGFALALRAFLPLVWDTSSIYHHLPHLFLWNFTLGWLVYFALAAKSGASKVGAGLAAVAAAFVAWQGPTHPQFWSLALGTACVLALPRVRMPTGAARVVTLTSQATFAIFLLHRELMYAYPKLPWRPWLGADARWFVAMTGSIAVWIAFTATLRALRRARSEPKLHVQPRRELRRAA